MKWAKIQMYVLIHIKYELVYHQNHVRIRASFPHIFDMCGVFFYTFMDKTMVKLELQKSGPKKFGLHKGTKTVT